MTAFFGDYDTTETVYIPFNTFDSNDPSASVTATTLLNTDCHVHKDGAIAQRTSSAGETLSLNFDGVTGNHLLALDLSDDTDAGFYAAGSTYQVRIEGATVDGGNINAWIGAFSVGRMLRPTTAADAVWDEVLTGGTHNVVNSAGRRLRQLQEAGTYAGAIWVDTVNGTAGTTDFENGTDSNPVDTIADANTLAASLGISRFKIAPGSTITLAATQANQIFEGNSWTLALGGQSIDGSTFFGATVSGVGTNTADSQYFIDCNMGACTLPGDTHCIGCAIAGTQTVGESGDYFWSNCHSAVAGVATPTLDINSVANVNINWRHYSGGLAVANAVATTTMSYESDGQLVINATCTSLAASIRGCCSLTDNGTTSSITDDARYAEGQNIGIDWSNVSNQGTAVDLSATDIQLCDTITTYTGNTKQTGDTYALANGANGFVALKFDTAAILFDTGTELPATLSAIQGVGFDTDFDALVKIRDELVVVDGNVDAILVDTGEIGAAGAGLTDLGGMSTGMKAEVNTEAADVLFTDTDAEPAQGAPAATATLAGKIGYLYKAWRNRSTQNATTYSLYNDDATTVDHKATVSDDGTTADKGEVGTGP